MLESFYLIKLIDLKDYQFILKSNLLRYANLILIKVFLYFLEPKIMNN